MIAVIVAFAVGALFGLLLGGLFCAAGRSTGGVDPSSLSSPERAVAEHVRRRSGR